MHEKLMEQAESLVRSSVRKVSAERLRGQVQVLNWASVRDAFDKAMGELSATVERLTREGEQRKQAAVPGETAEQRAARLEKEVAALRERLAQYEDAMDALDLIEDFDLSAFEEQVNAVAERAAKTEAACQKKGKAVALKSKAEELLPRARETEQKMSENLTRLFEGHGDMRVFLALVRAGRAVRMLWQRLGSVEEMIDAVEKVV